MPTRTPISAGNWKMHKTTADAVALAQAVREAGDVPGVEVVVAPSFLQLAAVADCLAGSRVGVAGQTMHADPAGASTSARPIPPATPKSRPPSPTASAPSSAWANSSPSARPARPRMSFNAR
jgi:hypothetical protein